MDEDELEEELEALQQEQLDEQMLNTGTVPVADEVHRMPKVANGEREFSAPPTRVGKIHASSESWTTRKARGRLENFEAC